MSFKAEIGVRILVLAGAKPKPLVLPLLVPFFFFIVGWPELPWMWVTPATPHNFTHMDGFRHLKGNTGHF